VQTALLAQKLGRTPILVMDRYRELDLILRVSKRLGVKPCLGVRAKLQARGAGKWAESGGSSSKFGLTTTEITEAIARLRADGLLDSLQLLHFHIGSQIPSIRMVKSALQEASRVFVELHALGAGMRYFDVGGGLGVDYDGSRTNFHSSMNYTVQEYANDVVSAIQDGHPGGVRPAGNSPPDDRDGIRPCARRAPRRVDRQRPRRGRDGE
jgi:arginine decarboxylase